MATDTEADPTATDAPPRMYADLVVHDGNVVSMDDDGINEDPGTVGDGLVVRDGEIVELTTGDGHERWIGPETTVIDLEGRTVIPGIVDAHSHLQQFGARHLGPAIAPESWNRHMVTITGEFDSAEALKEEVIAIIEEKTEELDAGEFVLVMPNNYEVIFSKIPERFAEYTSLEHPEDVDHYHKLARHQDLQPLGAEVIADELLDKDDLDALAPDHPVLLMTHPYYLMNEPAYDWFEERYGQRPMETETVNLARCLMFDVLLEGDEGLIADLIRAAQEIYLMNGVTTYATHVYPMTALDGFLQLERGGEVCPRVAFGLSNLYILNPEMATFHKRLQQFQGFGSDSLWCGGYSLSGMDGGPPAVATTLEAPEAVKSKELHNRIEPGAPELETLKVIAERGGRFAASNHAIGDKTVDACIEAIVEGSARGGLDVEAIRERNHALDHGGFYPRPDHVDLAKEYNIRFNINVWEGWRILHLTKMLEAYPEEEHERALGWVAAARTALDNGLVVGYHGKELENPFAHLAMFVTRQVNGDPVAPDQAIDRVRALKMATTWNADYVLRGEEIGSLEPGKRADFIVLSDDYFSVPEAEIEEIESLMTVVDGDVKFHTPELDA